MIRFKKLRYKNFLSTGNYFIEIELDKCHKTLMVGKNGHGKSTMRNALCYGLFGKADRDVNKGNLVNSINKKNLLVEVEFSFHGKEYLVRRGMKPDIFEIYCDGILIDKAAKKKDYQKILEDDILHLNYETFKQIVILSATGYTPFMRLPLAKRREVVETILDLQIFSEMNRVLKTKIAANRDAIAANASDLSRLKSNLAIYKENYEELKQTSNSEEIEWREAIKENEQKIAALVQQRGQLEEKLVAEESLQKMVQALNEALQAEESRHRDIEYEQVTVDKSIKFFENRDDCPTCQRTIEQDFRQSKIAELTKRVEELEFEKTKREAATRAIREKLDKVIDKIDKLRAIRLKVATIDSNIAAIREANDDINDKLQNFAKNRQEQLDKIKDRIKSVVSTLTEMTDAREKLLREKEHLLVVQELLKDDAIKASIIKQYIPVINTLINQYLSALNFYASFNLDENFNEVIKSRHRDKYTYENFSDGEKQRIDLAILFTWREIAKMRNSMNTNLLIMDEIGDSSLDAEGIDNLFTSIFDEFKDTNIFVITHKHSEVTDLFDRLLHFEKKNNFSNMTETMLHD